MHEDNLPNSTRISNYALHFNLITTSWYLIGVTTKEEFLISPGRKGRQPNHHLIQNDEEADGFLVNSAVSKRLQRHYNNHLGNNNKEENNIGCIKPYQNKRNNTSRKMFPLVLIWVRQRGAWNFTHVIPLPRNCYLLTHFSTNFFSFSQFWGHEIFTHC